MSNLPNDDVRVNNRSTAVMKTKKDQDSKTMNNMSKKASMGTGKKKGSNKRNITVRNSVTTY
jgi:hypothetical protein